MPFTGHYSHLQTLANFLQVWSCWPLLALTTEEWYSHRTVLRVQWGSSGGLGAPALPGTTMKGGISTTYGDLEGAGMCCHHGTKVPPRAGLFLPASGLAFLLLWDSSFCCLQNHSCSFHLTPFSAQSFQAIQLALKGAWNPCLRQDTVLGRHISSCIPHLLW